MSQGVFATDTVHARIETIAASCLSVSGRASGAALAAAVMARSVAALGIAMDGRRAMLETALHPTTIGSEQADGPSHRTAFHKGHVVATPLARKFYEACGFELTGDAPTRFGPALAMRRAL